MAKRKKNHARMILMGKMSGGRPRKKLTDAKLPEVEDAAKYAVIENSDEKERGSHSLENYEGEVPQLLGSDFCGLVKEAELSEEVEEAGEIVVGAETIHTGGNTRRCEDAFD